MPISVFLKANVQRFLSKALKAKLSSIPSQIANLLTPDLDQLSGKTSADMPLFDHQPWRQLPQARGPVGGPLSNGMWCVLFVWSFRCSLFLSLSLSVEEGRFTFGVMARTWAKF